MLDFLLNLVAAVYFLAAFTLVLYGLNCYVAIALFARRRREAEAQRRDLLERFGDPMDRGDLPCVTTQLPVYNELNVVERAMEAACRMRYPAGKHQVQVLDDSDDETREVIDRKATWLRDQGFDIDVIRRKGREGFKAGALKVGMARARGELFAIFDADFVPPEDYLLRTVPFFLAEERLGLVQARWGHLNRSQSLLTQAQSVGIDGHFMIEQSARAWNGLFMNFNGTAGIWRREAIAEAGGWQWDTLTEDMDLSYRAQLAGWKMTYLPDVVVPAEIPEDVSAFKSQQFRWAKGSIQTAMKLLPLLAKTREPIFKKIQAFFHLTHYMVHPMMLVLSVLALPVLVSLELSISRLGYALLGSGLILAMSAPSSLYFFSQRAAYDDWPRRLLVLPALVIIGVGVAVSNSKAVLEALIGRQSDFVRTPKRGDREVKRYRVRLPGVAIAELLLGLYCTISLTFYIMQQKYLVGPFLAIYASGFLFVGLLSVAQALGISDRSFQRLTFSVQNHRSKISP